jgi:hypothetical protein
MSAYHDFITHFVTQNLIPIGRTTEVPEDIEASGIRYVAHPSGLHFTVRCVHFDDAGMMAKDPEVRCVLDAFGPRYCTAEFSTHDREPRPQTQAKVDAMNRPCLVTFWSGDSEPARQAIVWPQGRGWHDMPSIRL